jgi:hypothetical protein
MGQTTYKVADSVEFMRLAAEAISAGYNRQLDLNKLAEVLDPQGINVVSFSMLHEHIAGVQAAPHMRTMWMIKLKGGMEFETVTLDVSMGNFTKLKEVPAPNTKRRHA